VVILQQDLSLQLIIVRSTKSNQSGMFITNIVLAAFPALLKAWAFSGSPGAAARSEEIIEQMENSTKEKPDVRSYTTLISCYGRSKELGAPQKAEKVLNHMDELHKKGLLTEGPNHRTFLALKKAWEVSHEPNKEEALQALYQKMLARFPKEARNKWVTK
jgi:hypothetical protein